VSRAPVPAPRDGGEILREQGLQVAMRVVSTLRTGRSYAIGNQAFTRQLEQLLDALVPVLAEHGEALVVSLDGDVYVNGERLPLRSSSLRFLEQLAQEFQVREIAGVEFHAGLDLAELEAFMRYFLPSELYKGGELVQACATQDFRHVVPVEALDAGEPADASCAAVPPADPVAAPDAWIRALQNAQRLLGGEPGPRALELRTLKRVTQPIVDVVCSEPPGTAALADARRADVAGWEHAAHVCLLAVAVGRQLGLDRAALSELGVAALLHDAGKDAVAGLVRRPLDSRGPAERADAESHTLEGLRRVALSTTLNATSVVAMRAALEHHAGGQDGHPSFSPAWRPAAASRLVAIADAYLTLLARCDGGRPALAPGEALGCVLGPLGSRFHPGLRAALVKALGVHPPGQVLELDDGSVVLSLGGGPDDPERPAVEWLAGAGGGELAPGSRAAGPLPAERSVRRALAEWPARAA
jgi:HD-GYP domain-containing protein (c-di-GMP phosphodiesterase class II)